jgi:hypothetical protein
LLTLTTRRTILACARGLLAGGLALPLVVDRPAQAQQKKEHHPHIRRAIEELREVKKELKEAAHDFGGHRAEAINAVDHAAEQMENALKLDKK